MKDYRKLRIIFMGTPEFAVASLDALVKAGCTIVAVITAPDKPAGRGLKLSQSDVKKYAVEKGLKILQPPKLKDPAFLEELRALEADLQIVVAFRMLPEVVWNKPPMGTINLHGSLLPQYRGAAPINWAVINGEKETGVTTFKLKHEIDTGNILLQESFSIGEDDTAGDVHDKMKVIGAGLLVSTVKGLAEGSLKETPQMITEKTSTEREPGTWIYEDPDHPETHTPFPVEFHRLHIAPKIHTSTCKIDWAKSVHEVYNLIRGLSPYPGAFTQLKDSKILKIFKANKEVGISHMAPGSIVTDYKTFMKFSCINGYINLQEVQMEGKKKMAIEDFLRGYR